MLVLTRKVGESIVVGGEIVVKVSQVSGNRVKLCIEAPRECRVVRSEILGSALAGPPQQLRNETAMCVPAGAQ